MVHRDDCRRSGDEQQAHQRHERFRRCADPSCAAREQQRRDGGENKAEREAQGGRARHRAGCARIDGADKGICNAADLHEIAHAERGERDEHPVDARKARPAETVGDVVHRSAADAAAAVIYRKGDLGVFYDHPDERRSP